MKKRYIEVLTAAAVIAVTLSVCGCGRTRESYHDVRSYGSESIEMYDIEMPYADAISRDCKLKYDAKKLQKKVDGLGDVYVYGNPVSCADRIAEIMGFDRDAYESDSGGGERFYKKGTASMHINEYGCFTYVDSSASWKGGEFSLTDSEYAEKAKQYLAERGLWHGDEIISDVSVAESTTSSSQGTKVVSKQVYFYPKSIDGVVVGGRKRITVEFNDEGMVSNVYYDWREYSSRNIAELIPVSEVLGNLSDFDVWVVIQGNDRADGEVDIKNVDVMYWDYSDENGGNAVIPCYVFTGTATNKNGDRCEIGLTVQATAVSGRGN
mgnify:FL=1|jgi:hypothetical protein